MLVLKGRCLNVLVRNLLLNDIKFTMEKVSKPLNILDVEIELNSHNTCVWHKPTYTGLLLNFYAICPTT